ncbi:MAG: hypothetical protein MHM6MM_004507 [Cercozoa sp. M6MM]
MEEDRIGEYLDDQKIIEPCSEDSRSVLAFLKDKLAVLSQDPKNETANAEIHSKLWELLLFPELFLEVFPQVHMFGRQRSLNSAELHQLGGCSNRENETLVQSIIRHKDVERANNWADSCFYLIHNDPRTLPLAVASKDERLLTALLPSRRNLLVRSEEKLPGIFEALFELHFSGTWHNVNTLNLALESMIEVPTHLGTESPPNSLFLATVALRIPMYLIKYVRDEDPVRSAKLLVKMTRSFVHPLWVFNSLCVCAIHNRGTPKQQPLLAFIEAFADCDELRELFRDQRQIYGITPLHEAAREGDSDMIRFLCEHILDANIGLNRGQTPLESLIGVADEMRRNLDESADTLERLDAEPWYSRIRKRAERARVQRLQDMMESQYETKKGKLMSAARILLDFGAKVRLFGEWNHLLREMMHHEIAAVAEAVLEYRSGQPELCAEVAGLIMNYALCCPELGVNERSVARQVHEVLQLDCDAASSTCSASASLGES